MVRDQHMATVSVCLIQECFDASACTRIRDAMDRGASEPAEILDDGITLDHRVRHASSIDVAQGTLDFVHTSLDAQRETVAAFFGITLTAREGAGLLRYEAGGFYRSHRDRGPVEAWPGAALRRISVVVFLNDSFTGGVLRLLDDPPEEIVPRQGQLIAFPADMLHEVTPVTAGVRDVIVDWFY